jgi:hypothetical protein
LQNLPHPKERMSPKGLIVSVMSSGGNGNGGRAVPNRNEDQDDDDTSIVMLEEDDDQDRTTSEGEEEEEDSVERYFVQTTSEKPGKLESTTEEEAEDEEEEEEEELEEMNGVYKSQTVSQDRRRHQHHPMTTTTSNNKDSRLEENERVSNLGIIATTSNSGKQIQRSEIEDNDDQFEDKRSTTSYEDLEVCEKCKREGEVLECDFKGCDKVWHVECVPSLRGQIPEGRWVCPAQHDEVCEICEGTGEVVVCDVKNCQRVYHISCVPALKGLVPKGFWECPLCVLDRETGLVCTVCKRNKIEGDSLVRCIDCTQAVHLGCIGGYGTRGHVSCAACNVKNHIVDPKRRKTVQFVRVELREDVNPIDIARLHQIIRGEATGLREEEAMAFLDATILTKSQ